jgi:hypothetical protein
MVTSVNSGFVVSFVANAEKRSPRRHFSFNAGEKIPALGQKANPDGGLLRRRSHTKSETAQRAARAHDRAQPPQTTSGVLKLDPPATCDVVHNVRVLPPWMNRYRIRRRATLFFTTVRRPALIFLGRRRDYPSDPHRVRLPRREKVDQFTASKALAIRGDGVDTAFSITA